MIITIVPVVAFTAPRNWHIKTLLSSLMNNNVIVMKDH